MYGARAQYQNGFIGYLKMMGALNDVELLKADEEKQRGGSNKRCIYALNLNHRGRFEHDMFIYNLGPEVEEEEGESLLIDVDTASAEGIVKFLNRYKLRSKVKIQDVSDKYDVVFSKSNLWNETPLDDIAGKFL